MKKVLILAMAMAMLVGAAFAQNTGTSGAAPNGPRRGPGNAHHRMMAYLAKQLQLTDAQKAQIKTLWQAEKPTMQPLLKQLADGRKQMMAATAGGAFDQAKVTPIAQAQAQVLAKLMVEKEKLQSQIYNQVLTAEQKTKADQLQQKHLQRMGNWQHHQGKAAKAGAAGGASTPQ